MKSKHVAVINNSSLAKAIEEGKKRKAEIARQQYKKPIERPKSMLDNLKEAIAYNKKMGFFK